MTDNQKWFLLSIAADIKLGVKPVSTYLQRDDYYLLRDLSVSDSRVFPLSPAEKKELIREMKLIQTADYGRFDTVIRLTKNGWKVAVELAIKLFEEVDETYWGEDYFWDTVSAITEARATKRMTAR